MTPTRDPTEIANTIRLLRQMNNMKAETLAELSRLASARLSELNLSVTGLPSRLCSRSPEHSSYQSRSSTR